ncbi:uncharacterized protein LOC128724946 [Anopheles nili]|uniref:uncharacterized protein LOC128724946 n=1 Tax=Anopheles nili TaxID=185578 RepID=UPI00237B3810|nr:uncharacterized protein LOC128724946 [Anopheles nili]
MDHVIPCYILMLALLQGSHSTLIELVDAIASYDNSSVISGTNICVFTTANSTLETMTPHLLKTLMSKYPTTLVAKGSYIDVRKRWTASLVLLDLTAFHYEFPSIYVQKSLNSHPCYRKSAKFVILMGGASFQRKHIALAFLEKFSILNFILVPLTTFNHSNSSLKVYTHNRFTKKELYFQSTDRPVQLFFPDKLRDLYGYKFMLHGLNSFPYIFFGLGIPRGVLQTFVDQLIWKYRNGTTYYTDNLKQRRAMDCWLNNQVDRKNFLNTVYFREQTGICLICPIRSGRDFLRHLLKPFSLGIWIVLGVLFAFCRAMEIIFPQIYKYDLIALTFFGGGGTEYLQPFQFRIITLTLAVLIFFLSEAYNTKIISLMTLSKFYELPQTLDEVAKSDYRILSTRVGTNTFGSLAPSFLSYPKSLREEKRLGNRVFDVYCMIMMLENAWMASTNPMTGARTNRYIVNELISVDVNVVQFPQHSPFVDIFDRFFGIFHDSGLWSYLVRRYKEVLYRSFDTKKVQFQEVIFFFDDLFCIWILIVVGWLISIVCFIAELIRNWLQQRNYKQYII